MNARISPDFYRRDVLEVAHELPGMLLVRQFEDGRKLSSRIVEVEAYRGMEDVACHASRGRTPRTEIMFGPGGFIYMYLIYGMYWMLNIVTGDPGQPQAVLLRGIELASGPGRLTRLYELTGDFYGEDLGTSGRLWLEQHTGEVRVLTGPRIGIDYAGDYWASRPWRFTGILHDR
jgi:DNA-3-methyladenine glycosylase